MCNGGTSKSKSAEALRLSTVRSVGASASIATRTWDNGRLPSFAPLEEIIWRRVETKPAAPAFMPLGRKTARGRFLVGEPVAMRCPAQVPLDRLKFPLTLAGGLWTAFADVASTPLPGRLATLMRRVSADRD